MARPNERKHLDESEQVIQYVLGGKDLNGLDVIPIERGFKLQTFGKFNRPLTPSLIDEFEVTNDVSHPRAHMDLVNHDIQGLGAEVIGPQSFSGLGHGKKTLSLATFPTGQDMAQLVIQAFPPLGIQDDHINLPGAFNAYMQLVETCMDPKVPAGMIKKGYGMLLNSGSRALYAHVKDVLEGIDYVVTTLGNGIRIQKNFQTKLGIDMLGLDRVLNEHQAPHCKVEHSYDQPGKGPTVNGFQGYIGLGHGAAKLFMPDDGGYVALELRGGKTAIQQDMNDMPAYAKAFRALNEMAR